MRVAIVSDTHIPSRASSIPAWVADEIRDADHTIHAGDFDSPDAYETVTDLAGEAFTAVSGNVDPPSLGLPDVATVELGGREFVVTHGTGSLHDYEERVAGVVRAERTSPDAVGISGHTHEVLDATVGGTRLLNPGSATGADPAEATTMFVAEVADGELSVELRRE